MQQESEKVAPPRRAPRQARSQARVADILDAAARLIGERGSDRVTMSDIARESGVAMGSLYAYFDGKPAIIAALGEKLMGDQSAALDDALATAGSLDEAIERMGMALDMMYANARENPVWHDVWVGLQANKELQRIDAEDSLRNGTRVMAHLQRFVPAERLEALYPALIMILHLSGATVRFAAVQDRESGNALVAAYRAMTKAELRRLASE